MRSLSGRLPGRQGALTVLALAAAVAGVLLLVVGLRGQRSAPQVPASAHGTLEPSRAGPAKPAPTTSPATSRAVEAVVRPLPRSEPVSLRIPAIGVHTQVFPIGKAPDGTLAVPQPGPRLDKAAWFDSSPTPGQPGPSVLEGHVDSERGPSVFFRLGDLRPGNRIEVTRRDGRVVVFTVNGVRDFKKSAFPTALVYGARDLSTPQLRLITCSDFDRSIGHHVGNTVVFAHLTGVHRDR
jgi:sortase (surface protein transpeptidase)